MAPRTGSSTRDRQTLAFSVEVSLKKKKKQRLVDETTTVAQYLLYTELNLRVKEKIAGSRIWPGLQYKAKCIRA